jgi:hypothetical protein
MVAQKGASQGAIGTTDLLLRSVGRLIRYVFYFLLLVVEVELI